MPDPVAEAAPESISVVIPNWNGRGWLPGCLKALASQIEPPAETIVVDNGSTDASLEYLRSTHPAVRVISLRTNTGFAHAANRGIWAATGEIVALLNTDVELAADWTRRMAGPLRTDPSVASVAGKMLAMADPRLIYDAGDVLRRDGACEQRGRFTVDDGRFDRSEEIFGACAGAALYRRRAVLEVGGFDERLYAYLEDVDLALRLRLAGWRCRYEPAVALHAGGGSSAAIGGADAHLRLVERNTLLLATRYFPARWLAQVAYRQAGWAWHALREQRLRAHLAGAADAVPMLPRALAERPALRRGARVRIEQVIPDRPIRGPLAGGHPSGHARGQVVQAGEARPGSG